jgi:hypothetical protein
VKTFVIGFVAGAVTYHFISGGFNNEELLTEMRGAIAKLDSHLATAEAEVKEEPQPETPDPGKPQS